jgi:hypothetical protein
MRRCREMSAVLCAGLVGLVGWIKPVIHPTTLGGRVAHHDQRAGMPDSLGASDVMAGTTNLFAGSYDSHCANYCCV